MENEVKLVKMTKDGEYLEVHPTTVQAHRGAGWFVVGEEPAPKENKPEQPFVVRDTHPQT